VCVIVFSDLSASVHTLCQVLKLVVNLQQIASHPQLVEPSAVLSSFYMQPIDYHTAGLVELFTDSSAYDVRR